MAQKKITDLQLISEVGDDLNFPSDDGVQSYRATALQIKEYITLPGSIPGSAIENETILSEKMAPNVLSRDNLDINGNFDYWQKGPGSFSPTNNTFTADMTWALLAGSSCVVSQQPTDLTEAFKARYFLRTVVTSSAGAGNYNLMARKIEDVRRLAGHNVTISFWAKASATRDLALELTQNFGSGGSPSSEVTGLGITKFTLTTSWQKFYATVSVPSISGKTIGSNNNNFTGVLFWMDAGSTWNSRTLNLGQQSGTFDIAQIKVEIGSNATAFTLAGKTLAGEYDACKRHYQKSYPAADAPGTAYANSFGGGSIATMLNAAGALNYGQKFSTEMRGAPSVTIYNPNSGASGSGRNAANSADSSSVSGMTPSASGYTFTIAGTASNGMCWHYVADAAIY